MLSRKYSHIMMCLFIMVAVLIGTRTASGDNKFEVAFEFNYINFTWTSPEQLSNLKYTPGKDLIAGIRVYRDTIYLAMPRFKDPARITLASFSIHSSKTNPLLTPYPSWEMNSGESCTSLQDVMSMEIDLQGIMWVIDARRVGNNTKCPPRIVLLDLNNGGAIVSDFIVPDELCPYAKGCFLNDIVVDGDFAYISDVTQESPGILVYHRRRSRAWKITDQTMYGVPEAEVFTAQGIERHGIGHVDGIALSPKCGFLRRLYYSPLSSFNMFSISNFILKQEYYSGKNVSKFVTNHGNKLGQSDGMICDEDGVIYYGLLPLDAVEKWNTCRPIKSATLVEQNNKTILWPDSFDFDEQGYLYLITNSILKFSVEDLNLKQINFRILRLYTGTRSSFYCSIKPHRPRIYE